MEAKMTKEEKQQEIERAIIEGTNIFIDLRETVSSFDDEIGKYTIEHGRVFRDEGKIVMSEKFAVIHDDYHGNKKFESLQDVSDFLKAEAEEAKKQMAEANASGDMRNYLHRKEIFTAWNTFSEKFHDALDNGKLTESKNQPLTLKFN
jgi:hypothetical protein